MSNTVNLKEIIEKKKYDWLDAVYINLFPIELKDVQTKTIALITESSDEPSDWGNGTFNSISSESEVEFFYAKNFSFDMQKTEVQVMKDLEKEGYRISNNRPHFIDPDTGQVIKTIYVKNKNKI